MSEKNPKVSGGMNEIKDDIIDDIKDTLEEETYEHHERHSHEYHFISHDDPHKAANKKRSEKRRNIYITLAFVFAAVWIALYCIVNVSGISKWTNTLVDAFMPVVLGAAIAYLCNPILKMFEAKLFFKIKRFKIKRTLSILCTFLLIITFITLLGVLVFPEVYRSIMEFVGNYNKYVEDVVSYVNNIINKLNSSSDRIYIDSTQINEYIKNVFSATSDIFDFVLQFAIKYIGNIVSSVSNIFLALFISIYLLASKETRLAQTNKAVKAICSKKQNEFLSNTVKLIDTSFGGFIEAKLICAIIVWIISFILFKLVGIPYALLIATVVGITDIIPIFGPFIGAIPSIFIIFVSDPSKVLIFIILCVLIQQIEGNIIGPKLLGENTGVSALCVLIAITIMGYYWGVFGMIVGVPMFAVIVNLVKSFIEYRLKKKNMSVDTEDYYREGDYIPPKEKEVSIMSSLYTKISNNISDKRAKSKSKKSTKSRVDGPNSVKRIDEKTLKKLDDENVSSSVNNSDDGE